MDFTIDSYKRLVAALKEADHSFQTFNDFLLDPKPNAIILRHDVDLLPHNSLRFAQIQAEAGVFGSYYFRAVPESWDEDVIKEIADLGHEVGYHYETMDTARGNIDQAWEQFQQHLENLRKLTTVSTICMHGSPRSEYDNKDVWQKYDYRSLDLIGEPYYDVDFDKLFYLTDTGRMWDGWKVSVRDKVPQQETWRKKGWVYHSTNDVIEAIRSGSIPRSIMFTFHPQRWHEKMGPWVSELIRQNAKNQIKRVMISTRSMLGNSQ